MGVASESSVKMIFRNLRADLEPVKFQMGPGSNCNNKTDSGTDNGPTAPAQEITGHTVEALKKARKKRMKKIQKKRSLKKKRKRNGRPLRMGFGTRWIGKPKLVSV